MTHPENEFGDFEGDFQNTEKAAQGAAPGRIPEGIYKVVVCEQDIKGDGKLVDHEVFKANSGTKGFKLFLEILEPKEVKEKGADKPVKTAGEVIEHVFWVTQKNLGFLKRDIATIIGRDLKSLNELTTLVWLGKTCEVGIKDDTYGGFKRSRVSFFNPWQPKGGAKAGGGKQPDAPAAAAASAPAGGAAPGEEEGGDPNF
jgi:hypothetical protein